MDFPWVGSGIRGWNFESPMKSAMLDFAIGFRRRDFEKNIISAR